MAHTLRVGRPELRHRVAVVAADPAGAVSALTDRRRHPSGDAGGAPPKVAFLFSGQGAQYAGMGAALYAARPSFAAAVDECAELLRAELGEDIRQLMFAEGGDDKLRETRFTQPALFTVEYALARLWQESGAQPAGMIGHSVGEYVAATLAGVFTLPDALRLVAARGRLMQSMPAGSMLAVMKDEREIADLLVDGVSVATVNGPGTCVVAGTEEAITAFAELLDGKGVKATLLRTSHAFHSPMMEPVLAEFESLVAAVPRQRPALPFLSNVTGDWITPEQAVDPAYWAGHIRRPVRFGDCVARLLADKDWVMLECGPGKQLAQLARMQLRGAKDVLPPLASLPGPGESAGDLEVLYGSAARLWSAGVPVAVDGGRGRRVPLPGYPYEREYRFIPPGEAGAAPKARPSGPRALEDWFEIPAWRQLAPSPLGEPVTRCLAFVSGERGEELVAALRAQGAQVTVVRPGAGYSGESGADHPGADHSGESGADRPGGFTVRPGERADYDALIGALGDSPPPRVVHAWALDSDPAQAQEHGFFSLLSLVQALAAAQRADGVRLDVLTCGTEDPWAAPT
nr:hypothetical protein GCM10020093_102140 [Planobispora longispora]